MTKLIVAQVPIGAQEQMGLNVKQAFLISATTSALLGAVCQASAGAPQDYFSQVIVEAPQNGLVGNIVNLQTGVNTGQVGPALVTLTNPVTSLYYDPTIGENVDEVGVLLATGNASALADRYNGELHAAAGPLVLDLSNGGGTSGFPASAEALFGDTLLFSNRSAGPTTLTTIGFSIQIDGTLSDPFTGPSSGQPFGSILLAVGNGGAIYTNGWDPYASPNVQSDTIQESWALTEGGSLAVDQTYTGTFSFIGPVASVPIYGQLDVGGQYGYANFADTAIFSFDQLSVGVSYTSASGDFLTGTPGVPEPSTWGMIVLGFAWLGYAGYRKTKTNRVVIDA